MTPLRWLAVTVALLFIVWWSITSMTFRLTTPFSEMAMALIWFGGVRWGRHIERREG